MWLYIYILYILCIYIYCYFVIVIVTFVLRLFYSSYLITKPLSAREYLLYFWPLKATVGEKHWLLFSGVDPCWGERGVLYLWPLHRRRPFMPKMHRVSQANRAIICPSTPLLPPHPPHPHPPAPPTHTLCVFFRLGRGGSAVAGSWIKAPPVCLSAPGFEPDIGQSVLIGVPWGRQERPGRYFVGGQFKGIQLWVELPFSLQHNTTQRRVERPKA